MRASPAQINSWHRRLGAKTIAPHVLRQALALKDMTAGQTDFLHVGRTKHLRVDDRIGKFVQKGARAESARCLACSRCWSQVPSANSTARTVRTCSSYACPAERWFDRGRFESKAQSKGDSAADRHGRSHFDFHSCFVSGVLICPK